MSVFSGTHLGFTLVSPLPSPVLSTPLPISFCLSSSHTYSFPVNRSRVSVFWDVLVYLVTPLLRTSVACCAVAILKKNRIEALNIKFLIWLLVHTKDFESEMTW